MAYRARSFDHNQARDSVSELMRAPKRIPISVAAERHVRVNNGDSWTQWKADVTPYMVEPMNLLDSREHESVIFCGPSRSGKTEALIGCAIGARVICKPSDMAFYFPDEEAANDYGRANLRRMNQMSPDLRKMLSPRGHDNNICSTVYKHGMLIRLLYPTSSKLSRITLNFVGFTEYDSNRTLKEGELFFLGKKRVTNAMSAGMAMAESSPKRHQTNPRWRPETPHEAPPTDGGILALYNMGDRRMLYWRCIDCLDWFKVPPLPSYDDLPSIKSASETAHIACPHCGRVYSHAEKPLLNTRENLRWVPEWFRIQYGEKLVKDLPHFIESENTIASYWQMGASAAFQPWPNMVANYLRALREYEKTGSEELLITSLNTDQGLPYLPKATGDIRSADDLRDRAEDYPRGVVPDEALIVITTVDVQTHRFVVQVHAFGPGCECWIIDRFDIGISARKTAGDEFAIVNPSSSPDDWKLLIPKTLEMRYPTTDGEPIQALVVGCDSGGEKGVTSQAYGFWRYCQREEGRVYQKRFKLLKGQKRLRDNMLPVEQRWTDSHRKDREASKQGSVLIHHVNGVLVKDDIHGCLWGGQENRGFIHIPSWYEHFDELVSEIRLPEKWEKVTKNTRNEGWDLLHYAKALLLEMGANTWGEKWENAPSWVFERTRSAAQRRPSGPKIVRKSSGYL